MIARNVIKEFKPSLTEKGEANITKWASAVFKFLALALVFTIPASYALQFYLVGAIVIIQLLPAVFLGLYTDWFKAEALIAGTAISIIAGLYMVLVVNHFGLITTTLYPTPIGSLYIGIIVLRPQHIRHNVAQRCYSSQLKDIDRPPSDFAVVPRGDFFRYYLNINPLFLGPLVYPRLWHL